MSPQPPQLDPERTFALLVAVETYTHRKITDLDGPAQDALGHAQWLLDSGVPARNIRLCVSAMRHNDTDVRTRAHAMGIPVLPATHDAVWTIIDKELPERHDDLLWFAWSGHGALDPRSDEHHLFYADAAPDREYTLNLDNLQKALQHSTRFQNTGRKALFVDACRGFMATVGGYAGSHLSVPAPGEGAQSLLLNMYAVQDGALANSDPDGGAFTRALLDELNSATASASAWPPDLTQLIEPVRARTADLAGRQTPRIDARDWNGTPYRWDAPTPRAPGLLDHREALRKLGPKGTYLSGDTLPYVAPDNPDDRAHPDNLLARLADPPTTSGYGGPLRGVLLTAPAGAGKTRTCLEVARRAHEKKWQVLHLEQDAGLSAADLLAEVQEEIKARPDRPLLLIFDYLDQHQGLDLKALVRDLYTEDQAGGRIACLASVRPGALRDVRKHGSQDLFEEIGLSQDDAYREAVAAQIFAKAAPRALEAWGYPKMAEICGERPIFALLHALAVEQLVGPDGPPAAPPRPRDLVNWLDRRTPEGLGSQPDGTPDRTALLAATVAALSCAQERQAVEAAVDRFLDSYAREPDDDGETIVNHLEALGWLVPTKADSPDTIDTVHDIVTDAFLQQTCLKDDVSVHSATLRKLLAALLGDLRSFRRATRHLTRWAADLHEQAQERLAAACSRWLGEHAEAFVAMLLTAPEHGMRLLVAMISTTPWRQGITDNWDTVIAPWTREVPQPALTRVFLANAIRNCDDRPPAPLTAAALTWLDENATTDIDAVHLINNLARPLADEDRDHLEARTRDWLQKYGTTAEARIRVEALLQVDDHRPAMAEEITRTAIALAERFPRDLGTERLLIPLLRSRHVAEDDWRRISTATQQWLKEHQTRERAAFVLSAALRQREIPASGAEYIVRLGFGWLVVHSPKQLANYVLAAIVGRNDLPNIKLVRKAAESAHTWLVDHGTRPAASFVLARLLHRAGTGTDPYDPGKTVDRALKWLDINVENKQADFVLRELLLCRNIATDDLDPQTVADTTFERSLRWLKKHGTTVDNTMLLSRLLGRGAEMTRDQRMRGAAIALDRMSRHPMSKKSTPEHGGTGVPPEPGHTYVLRELLELEELPPEQRDPIMERAETWIRAHDSGCADLCETTCNASFVLAPYIHRSRVSEAPTALRFGVTRALTWLETFGLTDGASYVLRVLLRCKDVATDELEASEVARLTLQYVLAWLAEPQNPEVSIRVLNGLIPRTDEVTDEQAAQIGGLLLDRLEGQRRSGPSEQNHLLEYTLTLPPLPAPLEERLIQYAMVWLGPNGQKADLAESFVLNRLLHRLREAEAPHDPAIRRALRWLRELGRTADASFVLRQLLKLRNLPPKYAERAIGYGEAWLREEHRTTQEASFVIAPLLFQKRQLEAPDRGTVQQALDWLQQHGDGEEAWRVIRRLAEYAPSAPHHTALQDYAGRWIAAYPDALEEHAYLNEALQATGATSSAGVTTPS
ncbi:MULTISPECIES: caspase family protein [Streptomyces]|uniref:Caspase domain-containing protein n=1 Tax=Streptomyces dengpaensis TaxID=2049881 RepID=A0ABN5I5A4_9ACTN|nr:MULTISPECIES: caspase family protein [Streptomyces]AVH58246.1 hypothetical protein C4B68_23545 [Streptomyces dengpaensis]PIB08068.1 hypothetical protein B1C81_16800 [Streptomyces sp. HG99]